jgi:type I restriction enzyme M protein
VIYDLRTNQSFTLKERPLKRSHLDEFVALATLARRHERQESERFRPYSYDELVKRDKLNSKAVIPLSATYVGYDGIRRPCP